MAKMIVERIKERRMELGMTQQALADKSGVNFSTLRALESGRYKGGEEMMAGIAEALGVPIEEVYMADARDTKVICLCNNKGGCGKTSITSGLGSALALEGRRVLLVDCDMQMSLSDSLGFQQDRFNSVLRAFTETTVDMNSLIRPTGYEGVDIIISDFDMAAVEMMLYPRLKREFVFKNMLSGIIDRGHYDFILIDTNPTLGMVNINCLNASDYAIVPVELSRFGMLGLDTLTRFFNETILPINPDFSVMGVVFNKVDQRNAITKVARDSIKELFGNIIFKTSISDATAIANAQWEMQPLHIYNKKAKPAEQFTDLAKEVIKNA